MSLLTSLLLLIIVSRLLGQLFVRFNQPSIAGEILAGVLLGPGVLGLIHPNAALAGLSELSVFLIVLSAGMEMEFKDVLNALKGKGLMIGTLGFCIPLFCGICTGMAYRFDVMRTVFLGLAVSITALPVAVRILDSFGLLKSEIARYSIGTAVLNDIAALLALGVILGLPNEKTFGVVALSIVQTGGKLVILGGVILGVEWLLRRVKGHGIRMERIPEKLIDIFGSEALFGFLASFVLVFGAISDMLGFHFVIGAFFGALIVDKKFFFAKRYADLEKVIGSVTSGFLAPVFFAYLGLEFDVGTIRSPQFVVVVIIVSMVSKVFAGWLGGRLARLKEPQALGLGIILNGRGVMELVIASIAYEKGFIDKGLFSTLVLMGIVTTMLAPIMFRRFVFPGLNKRALARA